MRSATTSAKLPVQGRVRESDSAERKERIAIHATPEPLRRVKLRNRPPFPGFSRSFYRFPQLTASFVSAAIHVILVIVLALLAIVDSRTGLSGLEVVSNQIETSQEVTSFDILKATTDVPTTEATESLQPASMSAGSIAQSQSQEPSPSTESVTLAALAPVNVQLGVESVEQTRLALTPLPAMFAHSSLEGRSAENRNKFALTRGGTRESEEAVEAALIWLAAHQYPNGSWSMGLIDPQGPCKGNCTHGTVELLDEKRFAATGLALLTFLGAGYTHQEGKYKDQVYRGLAYLTSSMKLDAPDARDPRFPGQLSGILAKHAMYEHGIASLSLCEAYQITKDKILEKYAQRAIFYIEQAQHYDGSWGYQRRDSGDLSIVGWQVMALKSANASDLTVDLQRIRRVTRFLDSKQTQGGTRYLYRGPVATPSMTAIGILMRLYLGYTRTTPALLAGANFIAREGPSTHDVYLNYYGTQALYQMESPLWPKWNVQLRDYLIREQNKKGHEAGSWFFLDDDPPGFNRTGGRLYTTTMSAMTLEVYYRYMPVYNNPNESPFKL
jgi:hypothetical protein